MGHKSASTVVCAHHARSAVGVQSASTVVSALQCKECGGASICEHGRIRYSCKECGAVKAEAEAELLGDVDAAEQGVKRKRGPYTKVPCPHGVKYRSACKVCSACPHGRQRSRCKECGGAQSASTVVGALECKECGGAAICEHGRRRSQCKECGGSSNLRARSSAP